MKLIETKKPPEKKANLLKDHGINNIGKLRALGEQTVENEAQIKQIVKYCNGISKGGLMKMIAACQGAIPGSRPPIASYVNEANPYKAKFGYQIDQWGVPAWKREIRKTTALSGVKCITELIEHIAIESQQCFSDTEYYNSYHWYHDALSQLTANETIEYMKNTNIPGEGNTKIFDRWIKPELGLNDKFGKRWMGRPIGNSPELMPLDNSCNQDVHESVRRHVVMSLSVCGNVADNDPRRFSTSTPKQGLSAYLRVFDPKTGVAPRPDRIVQDVHKVVNACKEIYKAKGVYVPGLAGGRVAGHRHTATSKKSNNNHGGKRVRLEYNDAINDAAMHEDLRAILDEAEGDTTSKYMLPKDFDEDV
jgi:hypothetical protein